MPTIVNDRAALSVGLYVGLSPSEPCRNSEAIEIPFAFRTWVRPRETPIAYSGPIRGEYCIVFIRHNTASSVDVLNTENRH